MGRVTIHWFRYSQQFDGYLQLVVVFSSQSNLGITTWKGYRHISSREIDVTATKGMGTSSGVTPLPGP